MCGRAAWVNPFSRCSLAPLKKHAGPPQVFLGPLWGETREASLSGWAQCKRRGKPVGVCERRCSIGRAWPHLRVAALLGTIAYFSGRSAAMQNPDAEFSRKSRLGCKTNGLVRCIATRFAAYAAPTGSGGACARGRSGVSRETPLQVTTDTDNTGDATGGSAASRTQDPSMDASQHQSTARRASVAGRRNSGWCEPPFRR